MNGSQCNMKRILWMFFWDGTVNNHCFCQCFAV